MYGAQYVRLVSMSDHTHTIPVRDNLLLLPFLLLSIALFATATYLVETSTLLDLMESSRLRDAAVIGATGLVVSVGCACRFAYLYSRYVSRLR